MSNDAADHRPEPGRATVLETNLHGAIARKIGIAIVGGHYQPGDTLSGEIGSSEQLKVSRGVYREAIRMLSAKGLVQSRPKTGTHVTPRRQWNLLDPDVMAWMFEAGPSEQFLRELFELRAVVEPAAAALAAERRSTSQLARMGHALEEMSRHGLAVPEGQAADRMFHYEILEAACNEPLLALASTIAAVVNWTTIYKHTHYHIPRDALPEHRILFEAIAAGCPQRARLAMLDLIRLALEDTRLSPTSAPAAATA